MMLYSTFQYLIESTSYLILFLLIYRLFIAGLTHFTWMRVYLLVSLFLCLILPLITLPANWHHVLPGSSSIGKPLNYTFLNINPDLSSGNSMNATLESKHISLGGILAFLLITIYLSGALFRLYQLAKKLLHIRSSIRQHHREKMGNYWLIQVKSQIPACSFLNYIFINKNLANLSKSELDRIHFHEAIHVKQGHTLDILFAELVSVFFWFNPLMKIFRTHLKEVHEYLADEKTLSHTEMKKSYSNLLLKLTTEGQAFNLSSGFSAKLIRHRIMMMSKVRSLPRQKLLFFLLLPAALILLMSFSYFENRSSASPVALEVQAANVPTISQLKVGKISWEGNTIYTDARLTKELGIKPGDAYSPEHLKERLWLDIDAVSSLYMDQGYLFFNGEVSEEPKEDGVMDLTISLYGGVQAKIGQITIEGNGSVPKQEIIDVILILPGELFSRTKLINSAHAIQQLKKFDPEKILINPIPKPDQFNGEFTIVDIEFILTEN